MNTTKPRLNATQTPMLASTQWIVITQFASGEQMISDFFSEETARECAAMTGESIKWSRLFKREGCY